MINTQIAHGSILVDPIRFVPFKQSPDLIFKKADPLICVVLGFRDATVLNLTHVA